ncbi:MAG: penicillin acylase family protein [Acidobacteriaceae bacterium]|jgi:acyl-homoserine-lactone acylase|nr:penicillin acylase family protein [Acidobacteriaceae bacterium]
MPRRLSIVVVLLAAATFVSCARSPAAPKGEILWDHYGVPHIFAATREDMFYQEGWAQMSAQADLLLQLYGESRGRAAEYWGASHAALDRWVQLNGVPERAREWYDAQDPAFRKYLDAFAAGINDYATAHLDKITPEYRVVLPVTGVDVVGHPLRAVHYGYMASPSRMEREVRAFQNAAKSSGAATKVAEVQRDDEAFAAGSNTWSLAPSRTTTGHAMLLINPHLEWGNTFYRYMEMQLTAPDYDFYGTPQIGFPVPVIGFNRHAGWGRTVNTIDTVDFYKLTLKDDGYLFDGQVKPFERSTKTIKVKQADGSFTEETIEIRRSVHGPVVYDENGLTVAMRVAGLDRPRMLEQWFRMSEATTLDQFKQALQVMAVPMWHANYADDQGHIMFVFDGLVPRRSGQDYAYWSKIVPGDTSETLWTDYLTFDELPKSIDPEAGYHHNANEPPWDVTMPHLDRTKYPSYVAPTGEALPQMRVLRSLTLITAAPKVTYEQFVANKHSTRMELADRVLPDLLAAANGKTEAARVLAQWDRTTDADSRGGVLFQLFYEKYFVNEAGIAPKLKVKFDPDRPLDTARGLADPKGALAALAAAADECMTRYGALDVKWGDVYRFASGTADLPGNGGAGSSGLFRTIAFTKKVGNKYYAANGETIVCAIEFGPSQRANCVLGYGNASQPGSPHLEDQLPLMVEKTLHPVLRDRPEIEAQLESRESF